ncbi:hypothetical protein PRIPAC_95591 [Pristionchus pacificus]|uniref:Uncharacterized protein n=1 Tax=Pristionchus pacificus TaxID=54126 RepID=A0A2A6BJP8_PRIPA|nr:hypothetical protein PRIPAC_95591 [Pristionchus pacificus]|eukprot:PDM66145.1 hypothetical protein PRIPAC_45370 [Pristionchus pacificus]
MLSNLNVLVSVLIVWKRERKGRGILTCLIFIERQRLSFGEVSGRGRLDDEREAEKKKIDEMDDHCLRISRKLRYEDS